MLNKQSLSQWKDSLLVFNGHEHNLQSVLTMAAAGPLIRIKLHAVGNQNPFKFEIPPSITLDSQEAMDTLDTVFYKHEGKYLVLVGAKHIAKTTKTELQGRLLSTPALKKARIIPNMPEAPIINLAPVWSPRYPPASERRPFSRS